MPPPFFCDYYYPKWVVKLEVQVQTKLLAVHRRRWVGFSSSVGRAQGWKPWGRWFEPNLKQKVNKNLKLYLGLILDKQNYVFINNLLQSQKVDNLFLSPTSFYFLSMHLRFSTLFYSTQLVDIFSYEVPTTVNKALPANPQNYNLGSSSVLAYNYHMLNSHNKLIVFTKGSSFNPTNYAMGRPGSGCAVSSISELFSAANWLEREASELSGVSFTGKKDLRNLMLQYGDTTTPFKKSFPTVGLKEMFYNPIKDTIIQNPVSLQI